MLLTRQTSQDGDSPDVSAFWKLFENSSIPMALIDRDRRCVEVNDATLRLFRYTRDEVIGQRAGRTVTDSDPGDADRRWGQLLRTNELYGEDTVGHPSGRPMRVSYAAHGSFISGRWLALFVTLSARFEPNGVELIRTVQETPEMKDDGAGRRAPALTPREREVVRLVALGASTRQIAADLFLSPATVRSHVRNAMVKTDAHTRAQLVAIVLGDGLAGG
jgi:PAS domain S-box-containing protein